MPGFTTWLSLDTFYAGQPALLAILRKAKKGKKK